MYGFDMNWCIKSADSMGDCGADSYQTCTFKCLIPMGDLSKMVVVVMDRLVGMGLRDWSLITGRGGGLQNGRGGHVKFYPYEKGGAENVLAMLKGGGGTNSFGVVFTR